MSFVNSGLGTTAVLLAKSAFLNCYRRRMPSAPAMVFGFIWDRCFEIRHLAFTRCSSKFDLYALLIGKVPQGALLLSNIRANLVHFFE